MEVDSFDIGPELPDIKHFNVFIPPFHIFPIQNHNGLLTFDTEFEPDLPSNRSTPSAWPDRRHAASTDSGVPSSENTPDMETKRNCNCKKYVKVEKFSNRINGTVGRQEMGLCSFYYAVDAKVIELVDTHFGDLATLDRQILFQYFCTQTYRSGTRMHLTKPLCIMGIAKKVEIERLIEVYEDMERFVRSTQPEMDEIPKRGFRVPHMYIPVATRHNWEEMQELCSTLLCSFYYHRSVSIHTRLTNILMEWLLGGIPLEEASWKYRIDIDEFHEVLGHSTILLLADKRCLEIIKSRNCEYFDGWGVLLLNEPCTHTEEERNYPF